MHYDRLQIANRVARKTFKNYHGKFPEEVRRPETYSPSVEVILGTYRKTQKLCSGYCCGNPRKWFGKLTIQERKNIEAHII